VSEYWVALKSSAEKELLGLPDIVLTRIFTKIESLASNPRPTGSKKLRGGKDLWRIRVGDSRAIYAIDDETKVVQVMRIAHRREVYE
jgi:mRNA interferase RelE/StbE